VTVGVYVGHVEISVVPTGDAPASDSHKGVATPKAPGETEERWLQSQARIEWLANRVRADDFND
jgi:hypothetical protein